MRIAVREVPAKVLPWLTALARRAMQDRTAVILVATNLVAAALAWSSEGVAASILFVYWAESVVIGALNIVRIYLVPPRRDGALAKYAVLRWALALVGRTLVSMVFVLHFGFFTLVTGGLILGLGPWGFSLADKAWPPFGEVTLLHLWPVLLIAASHAWSFVTKYIGQGEYRDSDLEDLMGRPYKRLGLMVIVVWPGVIFAGSFGAPIVAIALAFVPLKIVLDLVGHFNDHRRGEMLERSSML